jgi:hypothetical protein
MTTKRTWPYGDVANVARLLQFYNVLNEEQLAKRLEEHVKLEEEVVPHLRKQVKVYEEREGNLKRMLRTSFLLELTLVFLGLATGIGWLRATLNAARSAELEGRSAIIRRLDVLEGSLSVVLKRLEDTPSVAEKPAEGKPVTGIYDYGKPPISVNGYWELRVQPRRDCWLQVRWLPKTYSSSFQGTVKKDEEKVFEVPWGSAAAVRAGCPGDVRYFVGGTEVHPANTYRNPTMIEEVTVQLVKGIHE